MLKLLSSLRDYLANNLIIALYCIIGLIAFLILFYGMILFQPWNQTILITEKDIIIERGMTPTRIANLLYQEGIISNENSFLLGVKLIGATRKLQAGIYRFEGSISNYEVLQNLIKGRVLTTSVTFPEGITAEQTAKVVQDTYGIDSADFLLLVSDTALCRMYDIEASSLEGYLFPDTYRFNLDPTPEEIIRRMVGRFHEMVDDSMLSRIAAMNFDLHEIVTLASIIEGEAVLASERRTISALYHNRLRRRMHLQADPTIQYIIEDGPRRLLNKDLKIDSPYNTYLYYGLPPGPVNNPGLASLDAALNPDTTDILYMVANGDGAHVFSRTMREHLEAKARFDRIRREVRRNRPSP